MRRLVRIILFLVLPFLLMGILVFAKTGPRHPHVISISSDGNDVLYLAVAHDPESRFNLIRVCNNRTIEVNLPQESSHQTSAGNYNPSSITTSENRVAALSNYGRLFLFDEATLKPLGSLDISEKPITANETVFSQNGKYLFVSYLHSDGEFKFITVDTSALKVVWDYDGQDMFACDSTNRLARAVVRANNTWSLVELVEFEDGAPKSVASIPGNEPPPNLKTSVDHVVGKGIVIQDLEGNVVSTLDLEPTGSMKISRDGQRLVFHMLGSTSIVCFNLATFEIEKTFDVGDSLYPFAISDNGRFLVRTIVRRPTFWAWVFPSNVFSNTRDIGIWDMATGERVRTISDQRPLWSRFWLAVLGTLFWCSLWVWSGWDRRETSPIVGDILVISLLGLFAFYLRLIFGGFQVDPQRISAIGSLWFMSGLTALIALWFVFASRRLSFRIPVALLAIVIVWAGPLYLWRHYGLPAQGMPIGCLLMAFFVVTMSSWLKWRGWHVTQRIDDEEVLPARTGLQVSLIDLFVLPLAVGVLITTAEWLPLPSGIPVLEWIYYVLLSITLALVAMIGCWAALSTQRTKVRVLVGLMLIVLMSAILRTVYWNSSHLPIAWHIALGTGIGIYSFWALSMLRRAGWRLKRFASALAR